jgi:hypothetical protein
MSAPRRIGLERAGFEPPRNLRVYPSVPQADDAELLQRLRQERDDEPRERSSEEQMEYETGIPWQGPI